MQSVITRAPLLLVALSLCLPLPTRADSGRDSFDYMSPRPDAGLVARGTTLIFRAGPALRGDAWTSTVRVAGSASGAHAGEWVTAGGGKTRIFHPDREFAAGEKVTVSLTDGSGAVWSYDFAISRTEQRQLRGQRDWTEEYLEEAPLPSAATPAPGPSVQRAPFEVPPDFPNITVTYSDDPPTGSLFLSDIRFGPSQDGYLMILDNDGRPEFFRKVAGGAMDFRKHPNGLLTYFGRSGGTHFQVMDDTYTVIDQIGPGNGYVGALDAHDIVFLPDGNAVILVMDGQTVDMSAVVQGGNPAATVIGLIIQEIDPADNVVWQWRSWDHFEITDATFLDLTADRVDYVHVNAIDYHDRDDAFVITSRHMDEITKIDHATGDVLWRMGGKNNDFTLEGDTQWFNRQHGVRRLANGDLLLFDNGNNNTPQESRAVEYAVDEESHVARKVWEYRNTPSTYGFAMGISQRTGRGNTVIGWGATNPTLTEVRPDGSKTLEMTFDDRVFSYRAFRYQWKGLAPAPYVWADTTGSRLTVAFRRFGETSVHAYNVYGGTGANPTTLIGATEEHFLRVRTFVAGATMYFRVRELEKNGSEGPWSNEIAVQTPIRQGDLADDGGRPGADGRDADAAPDGVKQNVPNPFRTRTEIAFELPDAAAAAGDAVVRIFNVAGQQVRTIRSGTFSRNGSVIWDGLDAAGRKVPAGVYLYRLESTGYVGAKRMVLLR